MKLVNYRCNKCHQEKEELFNDSEIQPKSLKELCKCGGKFQKFNFKKNPHRVYIADRSGL